MPKILMILLVNNMQSTPLRASDTPFRAPMSAISHFVKNFHYDFCRFLITQKKVISSA